MIYPNPSLTGNPEGIGRKQPRVGHGEYTFCCVNYTEGNVLEGGYTDVDTLTVRRNPPIFGCLVGVYELIFRNSRLQHGLYGNPKMCQMNKMSHHHSHSRKMTAMKEEVPAVGAWTWWANESCCNSGICSILQVCWSLNFGPTKTMNQKHIVKWYGFVSERDFYRFILYFTNV